MLKKLEIFAKKLLRNFDINVVRKTVQPSPDNKMEKDISKGKNPAIALFVPNYAGAYGSGGAAIGYDQNDNPTKAELNIFRDDLLEEMEKEGLNYSFAWKIAPFAQRLEMA